MAKQRGPIARHDIVEVNYSVDQLFAESLRSEHIPKDIDILHLRCKEELLNRDTKVGAKVGFSIFKFGLDVIVTEFEENKTLTLASQSRDVSFDLGFDFLEISADESAVEYDFMLGFKSHRAEQARSIYGEEKTNRLVGGFIVGLIENVQAGLEETYGPVQKLSA